MKLSKLFFVLAFILAGLASHAQVTLNTITSSAGGFFNIISTPHNASVTFGVENNNPYPVTLSEVRMFRDPTSHNGAAYSLYYSSTSLGGTSATIAAPDWTLLASATPANVTAQGVAPIFTGLSLIIPANSSYRFFLTSSIGLWYFNAATTPNTVTSGNVSLKVNDAKLGTATGNVGIVSNSLTSITNTYNPRFFVGGVTVLIPPPCPPVTNFVTTDITPTSASIKWDPVAGATGYEYVLSTSTAPPTVGGTSTSSTSVVLSPLASNTTYILFVKTKCTPPSIEDWVPYTFTTFVKCDAPTGITKGSITATSADIAWNTISFVNEVEYSIDKDRNSPTAPVATIAAKELTATSLDPDTKYYIHLRSHCGTAQTSEWVLDSFNTKKLCKTSEMKVTDINTDQAVVSWKAVETVVDYTYAITTTATPPSGGTTIKYNAVHAPVLTDGKDYFFHLRCNCNDGGFISSSDWATLDFKTFPTSVTGQSKENVFKVYPNPAHNEITVHLSQAQLGGRLRITDIAGKEIANMPAKNEATVISLVGYHAGIYFIEYRTDASRQVMEFVKE